MICYLFIVVGAVRSLAVAAASAVRMHICLCLTLAQSHTQRLEGDVAVFLDVCGRVLGDMRCLVY